MKKNLIGESTWRVVIVTLTDATSDQIKLALLDVVDSISPGFDGSKYVSTHKDFFGCVFNARVTMRVLDFDSAYTQIKASLERHGVGFLTMIVRPNDDVIEGSCIICHGNIKREQNPDQGGPYRSVLSGHEVFPGRGPGG